MLLMGKLTISMVIFNSYFDITRGYKSCLDLGPNRDRPTGIDVSGFFPHDLPQ